MSEGCQSDRAWGPYAIVRPRAHRQILSMAPLQRPIGRPRSNATLLAGLLVCTLVLATLLAYEAHDAARSHRATAERALHDYAAVAAWELVAGVNNELQSSLAGALAPVTRPRASSPYELLPAPAVLSASAENSLRCPSAAGDASRFYFRIDFRDGTLATTGATPTPAMRAWLTDTITAHGRSVYKPNWNYAVVLGGPSLEERGAIAYAVKYAEHSAPIAAYGFRTCPDVVGPSMIQNVVARRPLLPASVSNGASNDSIVSIMVRDPEHRLVYQSPQTQSSPYSADAPLEQVGPLTVHAAIRPRAVELLALGSIPESRVPWLVGLLTLIAAMVALTVMQLRREHELSRLRADFISSVSHELRTPLSQILLFAETLNLGRVRTDQERRAATDVIVQEGRRLMHLVENILHFSRAERRMSRLGPEPLDLNQAVASIVEDWLPLASAADVRVRTQFASDAHAIADRSALRQMVLNLLDNAVKYGPATQMVTVGTSVVSTPSSMRARVWVDDEGDGIPERERERVWESFYRLDRHASSSVAGSGIGLYVVRELARLHDGDAWVEDALNGGARFVVELPAAPRAAGFTDEHPSTLDAPSPQGTLEPRP
jgi:signal transduction histidine kinase